MPALARPLTVLSVAFPFAPVGTDSVGGAEQVVAALDRALVAAGHRSIVVACAGSQIAGELRSVPPVPEGMVDGTVREARHRQVRETIARALRERRVDVVHLHGIDFAAYLPPPGPPVLATLHLPPDWYPPEALAPARRDTWLNCVSYRQHRQLLRDASGNDAEAAPPAWLLPPIGNGVDVEVLGAARHARRSFALTLGRVCPEKGQHLALMAAHASGVPLLLAGVVYPYPEHRAYFATEVAPLLGPHHRFIGARGFVRKRRLLAAARCVLLPSQAAETSSLVAMEALACGTPVIAFATGAVPEIIEHGRTGFLVRNAAEMAQAIREVDAIDPETCRRAARERFSLAPCIATYFDLYRRLAAGLAAAAAAAAAA